MKPLIRFLARIGSGKKSHRNANERKEPLPTDSPLLTELSSLLSGTVENCQAKTGCSQQEFQARLFEIIRRDHLGYPDNGLGGNPSIRIYESAPILFFHLEKTSGTSLHQALLGNYHPFEVCPQKIFNDETPVKYPLEKYSFVAAHTSFPFIAGFQDFFNLITVLRDPAERIYSLYTFYRNQPVETARADEGVNACQLHHLDGLLKMKSSSVFPRIDNFYARILRTTPLTSDQRLIDESTVTSSEERVAEALEFCSQYFAHIGFMDRLQDTEAFFQQEIKLKYFNLVHLNKNKSEDLDPYWKQVGYPSKAALLSVIEASPFTTLDNEIYRSLSNGRWTRAVDLVPPRMRYDQ